MAGALLYLLKANVALALFVAAYYGLLRRLTFLRANRAYLLLALGFAAAYPALPVPALLPAPAAAPAPAANGTAEGPRIRVITSTATAKEVPAPALDWLAVAGTVYGAGAAALLLRLLGQLASLGLLWRRSRPGVAQGHAVRVLPGEGGAFSFGNTIFLSPNTLRADPATLAALLRHEQAHVRQGHSLDVLLVQVAVALAWPNPAAWLLRRAVLDNLEYLADEAALQTGLDRRAYQYSLLQLVPRAVPAPALAFHLHPLTLKNRINMLNQPHSSARQLGRYLLAGPLVLALALGLAGARAKSAPAHPAALPGANLALSASPRPATAQPDAPTAATPAAVVAAPAAAVPAAAAQRLAANAIALLPAVPVAVQLPAASPQAMPLPAQTGPGTPANALYYLDGKPSTKAATDALDKETIASIDVVKGNEAVQRLKPGSTATAAIVFTTKANANSPAVLALAEQGDLGAAYDYKKIETNAIPLQTLSYIVAHYPNDRLVELQEVRKKNTGALARYMVMLARGRRPFFVNLTPSGAFISDTAGS